MGHETLQNKRLCQWFWHDQKGPHSGVTGFDHFQGVWRDQGELRLKIWDQKITMLGFGLFHRFLAFSCFLKNSFTQVFEITSIEIK